MSRFKTNEEAYTEALKYMPGGASSGLKKIKPILAWDRAKGSYIWDVEGNRFIDYHGAWGPIILGHNDEYVSNKVIEAIQRYSNIGVGISEPEIDFCQRIVEDIPSAEKVLMTVSGSEATFLALRVSRAITGRQKFIKFQGGFHGYYDEVLRNVLSPADKMYKDDFVSAGTHIAAAMDTLICRVNDLENVAETMKANRGQIAALIIEPVCYNMGGVSLDDEFLRGLRSLCDQEGIILIFDEVVTGYRVGLGSYESICGVHPDLITLGKAIANGYQLAAICGKEEIMNRFNSTETGDVIIQSTFNGNSIMAAAGAATIDRLREPGFYDSLFGKLNMLADGLRDIFKRTGMEEKVQVFNVGGIMQLFFGKGSYRCYDDTLDVDQEKSVEFRLGLVERGSYFVPSDRKRIMVFDSHTKQDINETLTAAEDVALTMKKKYGW